MVNTWACVPIGMKQGGRPVENDEERVEEEPVEVDAEEGDATHRWDGVATTGELVFVETGRGQTAEVRVGTPFQEAVEQVANEAHYGGYYRVFLNGEEVLEPEEAPTAIEAGMRIAITSYDKVGVA